MEKEEIEELKALIPSEYVRNYVLENGWDCTDGMKATLLVNGFLPLKEQYSRLRTLKDSTADQTLKQQIEEYLNKSELDFQAFKENSDKSHIYILKVMNEDISHTKKLPGGYFFDWEMACEYGRKKNMPFVIEKHLVGDMEHLDHYEGLGYYDYEIAYLCFNKDGEADFFESQERPEEYRESDHIDYHENFQDAYHEILNPFEKGDIIRIIGEEGYGIVCTSQEEWEERLLKHRSPEWLQKGIPLDWSDNTITVELLNEDGTFSHRHTYPIYLERYQPEGEWWNDGSPQDKLLMCASLLHQGNGSLEALYFAAMEYRESQRAD